MAKKKAEDIKLTLTDEEREGLDNDGVKRVLTNKAVLDVAKGYEFSEEEKEEFDYFFTNEKHKFFVAKLIEDIQIIKLILMHKIFLFHKLGKLSREIC